VTGPGAAEPDGAPHVAVLFIHGVEIRDPDYAGTAMRRLKAEIVKAAGVDAAARVHIERAYWIPVVADGEDRLAERALSKRFPAWARLLSSLVHLVDVGSTVAMAPLALTGLARRLPGLGGANWPTLRWAMTYFLGDVIAYQDGPGSPPYEGIHAEVNAALARLAAVAPDAPLCVISHSLGTVIASDHFYDLQKRSRTGGVAAATPLERGETLTLFYTLGSPIALWMIRYPAFDEPIALPARTSSDPVLMGAAQWINFHDPDDIVAYPLRGLSDAYAEAVDEDRVVSVGPVLLSATPISHVYYWNEKSILRPIAARIAVLLSNGTPGS
jgi:hypothetical protein